MSLPGITAPPGTPVFLASGHTVSEDSVYRTVKYGTGHSRSRRVTTIAERIVTVQWFLEAGDMEAVDDWFENTLVAGTRMFAAQVANQDAPGLLWWAARWISPPEYEMLHLGRAKLSGQLLLTGEGSVTGPDTTALAAEFEEALSANPILIPTNASLAAEFEEALIVPLLFFVEFEEALAQPEPGEPRVTEDDDDRVTEDGESRETEAI
jgi:hypothetical protein